MRIAFIAWTPLHIINILNVYESYYLNTEADLFIYSEFEGAKKYFRNIRKLSIFKKVILVDYKKIGSPILRKVSLITNKNRFFSDNINYYDELFIQGENYFSKIIFSNIKKQNPKLKLNYIEDGVGTYLERALFTTSAKVQKFINKWNKHSIFLQDISSYFVYCPDLLSYDSSKMRQIPKIEETSDLSFELKTIFGNKKIGTENKCLFFDQPLLHDGYGVDERVIAEQISKVLPSSKEIIIKIHPRGSQDRYGSKKILNSALPFEALLAGNSFDSTLLISPFSTVSFSPSMMFEKKIESVLLAQLLVNEYDHIPESKKEILEQIVSFCQRYNKVTKSKIHLPADWNELRKLVK